MMSSVEQLKQVVVLGAGVVGLTTALQIQEKGGYAVTIVAEHLPTDPKSIRYTSHWAGAHHVSVAGEDVRQQKFDLDTFKVFWELSEPGAPTEKCFLRITETSFFDTKTDDINALSWMPGFKVLSESELIPGALSGVSMSTLSIDVPIYLNYLLSRFLGAGGAIIRGSVQHINDVVEGGAGAYSGGKKPVPPHAVVVCTGLGARTLGGVEDKTMYPIRGQTLLVRAPWQRFSRAILKKDSLTYIIPRRSGDVIVGGTKDKGDWYPNPRPEISEAILQRAFVLCPELVSPEIRAVREPTVEDLRALIIEEGCGLRPGREDNIRLELQWIEGIGKGKVPIVFNYGHAGWGYQSSWGSATAAVELLEGALTEV